MTFDSTEWSSAVFRSKTERDWEKMAVARNWFFWRKKRSHQYLCRPKTLKTSKNAKGMVQCRSRWLWKCWLGNLIKVNHESPLRVESLTREGRSTCTILWRLIARWRTVLYNERQRLAPLNQALKSIFLPQLGLSFFFWHSTSFGPVRTLVFVQLSFAFNHH